MKNWIKFASESVLYIYSWSPKSVTFLLSLKEWPLPHVSIPSTVAILSCNTRFVPFLSRSGATHKLLTFLKPNFFNFLKFFGFETFSLSIFSLYYFPMQYSLPRFLVLWPASEARPHFHVRFCILHKWLIKIIIFSSNPQPQP